MINELVKTHKADILADASRKENLPGTLVICIESLKECLSFLSKLETNSFCQYNPCKHKGIFADYSVIEDCSDGCSVLLSCQNNRLLVKEPTAEEVGRFLCTKKGFKEFEKLLGLFPISKEDENALLKEISEAFK